ncbi:YheC/YheD family protein [Paenibacillus luteus]|uniref:YheC/YheD family protein n=1 Tax=Paenibacillus luteus TaxID=2545753 RepID=UPI0011435FB5|nr:YheC/YheD family protein [Paenibacillus luteus]
MGKKRGAALKRVRSVADKWAKTQLYQRDAILKKHLPATSRMTKDSLLGMLQQWGMVYVKPRRGAQGYGVMRAELNKGKGVGKLGHLYAYQLGTRKLSFGTYEAFYQSIAKAVKGEDYLVQKGIHLLKHQGRPFDIRVVVQRAPCGGWEATGTLGRVAHPDKIVTNGSQGGTIYPTAYLLRKHTKAAERKSMLNYMDQLGVRSAKKLERAYPGIKEIGLDLAIDRRLKPWILEVNTVPDPCPFTLLEDQSMLRKIIRYGRAYGKTYALNCKKAKRGL